MTADLDPETTIDWESCSIWVQDYGQLSHIVPIPGSESFEAERSGVGRVRLGAAELARRYQPARGGAMKRYYDPALGHRIGAVTTLAIGGDVVVLTPGDAVLRRGPAEFEVVASADYVANYMAVAFPVDRHRPAFPFAAA